MKCPYCKKTFDLKEAKMRTIPENKYYWGVVIELIAEEIGDNKMEVHEMLKAKFLSQVRFFKKGYKFEEVTIYKSTTDLSIAEFEDYLIKIRIWASKFLGMFIPLPNEDIDARLS